MGGGGGWGERGEGWVWERWYNAFSLRGQPPLLTENLVKPWKKTVCRELRTTGREEGRGGATNEGGCEKRGQKHKTWAKRRTANVAAAEERGRTGSNPVVGAANLGVNRSKTGGVQIGGLGPLFGAFVRGLWRRGIPLRAEVERGVENCDPLSHLHLLGGR